MYVCELPHLVEQGTVCYGNPQGGEAPAYDHVIRSIVTVAATTTGNKPGHRHPAKHHPTKQKQAFKYGLKSPQIYVTMFTRLCG